MEWFTLKLGMYVRNRNISLLFNISREGVDCDLKFEALLQNGNKSVSRKCINVPELSQYHTK